MSVIRIEDMSFYAFHGCFDAEQTIGTRFRVDATLQVDTRRAEQSDDLADTVNYADVYQVIKSEMEKPSHLLEHVARRIATAVMRNFRAVSEVTVKVTKLNPPLGGRIGGVSVELHVGEGVS